MQYVCKCLILAAFRCRLPALNIFCSMQLCAKCLILAASNCIELSLHSLHLHAIQCTQTPSEEPNRNCRKPALCTKPRAARGHTPLPSLMFDSPAPSTQASSLEALPLLRHSDICASCRACGICHEHRRRSARRARGCAGGERRRGESAGRTAVSRGAEAPYSASHERQEGIGEGARSSGREVPEEA